MPGLTISTDVHSTPSTNTLIITGLPRSFFYPQVLAALKEVFQSFGPVFAWAPIRAFNRIIVVYYSEDDAESAKLKCDGLTIDATARSPIMVLRVYRADPTPISPSSEDENDPYHLRPPPIERNFLISPPGSPPIGWEPIKEDPPNNAPLAEDLIAALRRLQMRDDADGESGGIFTLVEPEEAAGVGVYVQDCDENETRAEEAKRRQERYQSDGSHEEVWFYGMTSARSQRIMPTSMPPMRAKA